MSMFTPYSLVNQCILLKGVNKTRKEGISLCHSDCYFRNVAFISHGAFQIRANRIRLRRTVCLCVRVMILHKSNPHTALNTVADRAPAPSGFPHGLLTHSIARPHKETYQCLSHIRK